MVAIARSRRVGERVSMPPFQRVRRHVALVALVLVSAMPWAVAAQAPGEGAQSPRDSVHVPRESTQPWRSACHRVARAMLRGPADTAWRRSLEDLRFCDLTGATVLADAWRRARDSSVARDLYIATSWYRDARVLDALLLVAADEDGPTWPRVYAMHAMLKYLRPAYTYGPIGGAAEGGGLTTVSVASHSGISDGPVPIADTAARTVTRALLGTAARTRDPAVLVTARSLGEVALRDAIAGGAPDTLAADLLTGVPRGLECTSVFFALVPGRKSERWDRAIAQVTDCPQLAVEGLLRGWGNVREDSATLSDFASASRRLRDGRFFVALEALAGDTGAGWWRRTSALRVLASYIAPHVSLTPDELRSGRETRPAAPAEARPIDGWRPLPPDYRARTRALIERIAREDAAPAVRSSAQVMSRRLRWRW